MKIGIDARFFGSTGKGLGRYTQKLIENLERIDYENQYVIFLRKENFDEYRPQNPNFKKIMANYGWYGFSEQFFFPLLIWKHNLDIVHFPHFNVPIFYRKNIVVTIHDLILLHFPTVKNTTLNPFWYKIKFFAYRMVIKSAIKRASKIIAVSEFTKKDILENYKNVRNEKVVVTYESCEDFCFFSEKKDKEILKKYGIIKPYLLYVGNAYPHKNLEALVCEFGAQNKRWQDYTLVLVGKEDYFYRRLKAMISKDKIERIVFPGFVPDDELDCIYKNAHVYVFPSLYEGFGLPPLEAMSKGVPVLSSNHECMREILGDSALFFDAKNSFELSKALERILGDEKLRKALVEKGYSRASFFSWKKMAIETLKIYSSLERF